MKLAAITLITGALIWSCASKGSPRPGPVCPPSLPVRLSVLHSPPLTLPHAGQEKGILGEFFFHIVKICFVDKCNVTKDSFQDTLFNSTHSFLKSIADNESEIAFPISRPLKMWLTSDSYSGPPLRILKFIESPGYSLIMDVQIFNDKANEIVMKTLMTNTWPIIAFTLLLAGISGICVWILETYFNEEEFPRSFTKGSYEGFWWAFVSMTTVGYGDKTPKFIFGRVFGVFWILTGLVVIAIFTATATSALSVSANDLAAVEGKSIGVLRNTSAELEAKQRGANVTAFPSVERLFSELKADKIDGVFMDKYKAAYYLYHEPKDSQLKVFQSFSAEVRYDLAILESDFSTKLLGDDSCFEEHIERLDVDELLMKYLQPVAAYNEDSDSTSIFSGKSEATQRFLLVTMGVFLGLVLLGVIAELMYRKLWRDTKKVRSSEEEIGMKEVTVQPISVKGNLKEVEDKLGQLVREVSKLQEQLTVISSQANGTFSSAGQSSTRM